MCCEPVCWRSAAAIPIEASASHADDMLRRGIRTIVTSLQGNDAEHIYQTIYCARGQAENLINSTRRNFRPIEPVADRRLLTRYG